MFSKKTILNITMDTLNKIEKVKNKIDENSYQEFTNILNQIKSAEIKIKREELRRIAIEIAIRKAREKARRKAREEARRKAIEETKRNSIELKDKIKKFRSIDGRNVWNVMMILDKKCWIKNKRKKKEKNKKYFSRKNRYNIPRRNNSIKIRRNYR